MKEHDDQQVVPPQTDSTDESKNLSRREFLGKVAGAGLAISSASLLLANLPAVFAAPPYPGKKTGMLYRPLGRTGQRVSIISLGAMEVTNPGIVSRALDLGINYIDTAECYQGGNNEVMVGKVLRPRRSEAFLATKWHVGGGSRKQDLIQSVEGSLKRLGIDCIDLIQIHGAEGKEQLTSPGMREAFLALRKAGKVRFMGFTHHSQRAEVVREGIKAGWFDAMLIGYSFMSSPDLKAALAEAKKAGIGVVIMKSVAPAGAPQARQLFPNMSPHAAAVKWVLQDNSVSTDSVGMTTFDAMDEDLQAIGKPLHRAEAEALDNLAQAIKGEYCRMCGECTRQCPKGVAAADIMRCSMYHNSYRNPQLAQEAYARIPAGARLSSCTLCGECNGACPYKLAVTDRLRQARSFLV
jgi:uncharacterized protein